MKHSPFVDVVLTSFALSFPDSVLSWIPPFNKYSEYDPPGNVIGDFKYVSFLFSAHGLLTGYLGITFRSKDCGDHLAQHSRLVCIQEIIRHYSRESSSPREQCSLLYHLSSISPDPYSPLCVLCACLLTHCAAYVSLSIYLSFPWPPILLLKSL